jgi:hypothetical protein
MKLTEKRFNWARHFQRLARLFYDKAHSDAGRPDGYLLIQASIYYRKARVAMMLEEERRKGE